MFSCRRQRLDSPARSAKKPFGQGPRSEERTTVTAEILDGKSLSNEICAELARDVAAWVDRHAVIPCLAAVLVGEDPASEVYVRGKQRGCERAGMQSRLERLPSSASTEDLLQLVGRLNDDPAVHGILVQLPLPPDVDELRVLDAVDPLKDVDAFHPLNVGRIVQGRPRFLPCTPSGIQQLMIRRGIDPAGKHVVVVGRSDIVGKPMAIMMLQRGTGGDATVTVCHSRTPNLGDMTRTADILIVAVGRANLITGEMVKPGAVVIDVGMNRTEAGLVGDVDFESVRPVASRITPVPGGVGPLTVTMVLKNTFLAAQLQTEAAGG
jgi:methylenetetrahydrofolate dehydrogenase (NADP+)/methenyltetrahydrofolate cyclohydrolase